MPPLLKVVPVDVQVWYTFNIDKIIAVVSTAIYCDMFHFHDQYALVLPPKGRGLRIVALVAFSHWRDRKGAFFDSDTDRERAPSSSLFCQRYFVDLARESLARFGSLTYDRLYQPDFA